MSLVRLIALSVLSLALVGCPPTRDNVGPGTGGGNTYQKAMMVRDPYTGTQYELAYLFMVDTDYTCQTIIYDYGLAWWNLSNDVLWLTGVIYKGQFVEWESQFRSNYLWNQEGQWDYTVADFFYGNHGTGGYGTGDDDDDDVPPPEPGRDQEGTLGNDVSQADDTLTITSWNDDRVTGSISSVAGDFWFDAENCGYMDGGAIGGGVDGRAGSSDPDVP